MNDSLVTFAFEIANFVGLAALLAWLFFRPVRKALEDQRDQQRQQNEDAARKLAEAEQLRQDIEAQHDQLAETLAAMQAKAQAAASQEAERIVAEARLQIDRERTALKREALWIDKAQTAKIAHAVAVATHHTVKRFLEQIEGPDLEQVLVKAAGRELQAFATTSLAPVTVESATSLDADSQRLINSAAGTSATFRVVPELQGGLRIATARGLIDASIQGLADYAEQSLSAELEALVREGSESE